MRNYTRLEQNIKKSIEAALLRPRSIENHNPLEIAQAIALMKDMIPGKLYVVAHADRFVKDFSKTMERGAIHIRSVEQIMGLEIEDAVVINSGSPTARQIDIAGPIYSYLNIRNVRVWHISQWN